MPSALETMVKILKLEQDQKGKDSAVVGGLGAFAKSWADDARQQARQARQQILIDEIVDELGRYQHIEDDAERLGKLSYLLDRIMNRLPPPPAYQERLKTLEAEMGAASEPQRSQSPPRPQRPRGNRRQAKPQRPRPPGKFYGDDSATWDEDYTNVSKSAGSDLQPRPKLTRPPRRDAPARSPAQEAALLKALAARAASVKGIGAKLSELLAKLDLHTVSDLLYNFPRKYNDYTELKCIKDLAPGDTGPVIGTVKRTASVVGKGSRKDSIVEVSDGSGSLGARFFGQAYIASRLRPGDQIVLTGVVTHFRDSLQMANPEWEDLALENLHTTGIVPVYRLTKGMRPRLFRKAMKALLNDWSGKAPDPLPGAVLERAELADLGWALAQVHFPESWDHLRHARRRLVFDELLTLQLAMLGKRRDWQSAPGPPLELPDEALDSFMRSAFPFELTPAQEHAIAVIRRDMAREIPMNRLLQGDVGSGKTAVAIVAMALATLNRRQAAIMAPTSILAEQHYRGFCELIARLPEELQPAAALLTGAINAGEREAIHQGVADGSINLVVGTQALIQEDLDFHDLGAAVIDEQQRFGVDERGRLRGKGGNPHLLIMSATPFPRSLALTVYADLDITVIDQKPPGRLDVITKVIDPIARERLHGFVISQLEAGRQAFFIHPLIDDSEQSGTPSALAAYERLQRVFFRHRVCLLHGRMSAAEKEGVMSDFSAGDCDVMVATSIAEVGVDVPNASVIVIDGADRFGLAQLHQFRGRVGRGAHQSYCFLIPDEGAGLSADRLDGARSGEIDSSALSPSERRLLAMERSNDGFELAEMDWKIRGAGDLPGRRQSGGSQLQLLEQMKPELVELAQQEARTLHEEDPDLQMAEHQLLLGRIQARYADVADLS